MVARCIWVGLLLAVLVAANRPALGLAETSGNTSGNTSASASPAADEPLPAPEPPGPFPVPADLPGQARFVVVTLHDEVSLGMAAFVERVVAELGAGDILLLDINTFGGRVDAAVRIRDALLSARQQRAWTAAYIHPRAISAGALIALATDVIVVAPGATMGAATPVSIQGGEMQPVEEKTVSYMRKEMRATAEARGRSGDLAEAMVDADVEVPGLSPRGKLLTLDGKQALAWGVASAEAETLAGVMTALGYGPGPQGAGRAHTVHTVDWSWAEILAGFLSSSMLSGLLMSIGMLGIMIGLYTGGAPLPLAIGGMCLGLFFFGHHVVDLAGLEEVLLFALGTTLILFEVLVPGHILPGVIGVLLVVASLVLGLVSFDQVPVSVQWQEGWITRALAMVLGSIAVTAALGYGVMRALPTTRMGRKLLLEATISARAADRVEEQGRSLAGQQGTALSDLRPSGKVAIGAQRFDALAEHGFIAAGTAIEVLGSRGFSLVVRRAAASEQHAPAASRAMAGAAPADTASSPAKEST